MSQPSTGSVPTSIAAITLFAPDLPATKAFYQEVFGSEPVFEDPHSAVFQFSGLLINLLKEEAAPELIEPATVAPASSGARFVLTVPVDDVDAVCAVLDERGVKLLNGPIDRPWGIRTASFTDPAGHIWEIAK